jgi:hypothetical protein
MKEEFTMLKNARFAPQPELGERRSDEKAFGF